MRVKKKRSKGFIVFRNTICVLLSFVLITTVFFELTVKDRIYHVIIAEVKKVSHQAISEAVSNYLSENEYLCDNLVKITYDENTFVRSISENTYYVNQFKTEISKSSQIYIENIMISDGINVKLGNFTGLVSLSDVGPYIHFDIEASPTISCEIISSFKSVGMNQSLHHIELEMVVDIYVGNPLRIESIKFKSNFEIAQTVIIGNIPSTYGLISRY